MYNRNESRGNERFYDLNMGKKNVYQPMPDVLFQRRDEAFGGNRGYLEMVSGPNRQFSETISSMNSGFPKGNPGTDKTFFAGGFGGSRNSMSVNDREFSEQFPGGNREFQLMQRMGYSSEAAIGRPGNRFQNQPSKSFQGNRQEFGRFPANSNKFKKNYGNPSFKSPNNMGPKKGPKSTPSANGSTGQGTNVNKVPPQGPPQVGGQYLVGKNHRRNQKRKLKKAEVLVTQQGAEKSASANTSFQKGNSLKRPLSNSGTPTSSPAANKKPKNTPVQGGLQSSDGARVFKMAIVEKSHPHILLNQKQAEIIQNELVAAIDTEPPGTVLPQFLENEFREGVLYITCANETSKSWLGQKVNTVKKLKEDMNLFVVWQNNLPKRHLVTVWIPGTIDTETMKKRLDHQNPTLKAENWLVTNQKVINGKGQILTFSIHHRAFAKLKAVGFAAFWGLGTIIFNPGETLDNEDQVINAANQSESLEENAVKKEDAGNCSPSQEDSTCQLVENKGSEEENDATQVSSQEENVEGNEKKPSLVGESDDHSEALKTEKTEESNNENVIKPQENEDKEEGAVQQSPLQGSDNDKTSLGD